MAAKSSKQDPDLLTVEAVKAMDKGMEMAEYEARLEAKKKEVEKVNSSRISGAFIKAQAEATKVAIKDQEKALKDMEEVKKKALFTKISRYLDTFPFLQGKIPKITAKTSYAELEEILALIRAEMDSQRSLHQLRKYANYGFMVFGQYWGDGSRMTFLPPPLRLNLNGIDQYFQKGIFNQELEPLLLEIDIEYPALGRQSLFLRVAEAFGDVMLKTHAINTNPDARKILGLEKTPPKDIPGLDKL